MVLTLSRGVNNLSETIQVLKESPFGRISVDGKLSYPSKNDVQNVLVCSTVCEKTDVLTTYRCISSALPAKSSTNDLEKFTTNEANTNDERLGYSRCIEKSLSNDDNLEVDTPSENIAIQNCQNDTLEVNHRKLGQESKAVPNNNLKAKMFRNDFGYKFLSTKRLYDNRVSFHSKWSCFEVSDCSPVSGIYTDVPFETNIKQHQPNNLDTRLKLKADSRK